MRPRAPLLHISGSVVSEEDVRGWSGRVAELQAEVASLRRSDAHHRAVADSAIDYAIVATDCQGRVSRWNEGAHRILGWTEEEMLGEPLHRFFTDEDVASGQVEAEMLAALSTGHGKDERWHQRKNGERFWASGELTVLRDDDDRAIGYVKVLRDRTAQRLAEEERGRLEDQLRRLNEQLETDVSRRTAERDRLWESSPDLLVTLDFEGHLRAVNPAWTAVLGYAPDELIGLRVDDFLHPDDLPSAEKALREAAAGRLPSVDNRYRHKDGSYRRYHGYPPRISSTALSTQPDGT